MKTYIASTAAALLLLAGVATATAADKVIITPEHKTVIREYIQKKPLAAIEIPGLVELNIGQQVPKDVELQRIEVPDDTYEYVRVHDRTYVVDPQTREVIDVIE